MSEERLNSALRSISISSVNPELISDDMIKGLSTRRTTPAIWIALLFSLAVVGGTLVWWFELTDAEFYSSHQAVLSEKGNRKHRSSTILREGIPGMQALKTRQSHDTIKAHWVKVESYALKFSLPVDRSQLVHTGSVDIELNPTELLNIGIALDSASVYSSWGDGFTIDTILAKKANVTYLVGDSGSYIRMVIGNVLTHHWKSGDRMFSDSATSYPRPLAINVEVQTEPASASWKCLAGATTKFSSLNQDEWGSRHPKTLQLALRVGYSLAYQHKVVDSLVMLEFDDLGINLPVDRLLVPIRISTPWINRNDSVGARQRLSVVAWYFPNDELLAHLPKHIRDFIEPEYSATLSFVEAQLNADQLCALLDKPSAFGLCSIGDTTLRIDAIGPIPAR